jgi:DNA-binding transcriptional ArsR family regulator
MHSSAAMITLLTTFHSICGEFKINKPRSSLSHHFRVLRESGLVSTRREGTALLNTLRHDDIEPPFPGLLKAVLSVPARRR